MTFTFAAAVAWDPIGKQAVKNTSFQVYAQADTGFVTPLAITDTFGATLPGNILNSGSQGVFPEFEQATNSTVVITDPSHTYVWTVTAIMQDTSVAAFMDAPGSATSQAVRTKVAEEFADPESETHAVLNATILTEVAGAALPLDMPGALGVATVFTGDSIVHGADKLNDGFLLEVQQNSWPMYATVAAKGKIKRLANTGVGGNTSTQLLARFDADVLAYNPKVVVLAIGTNDIWQAVAQSVYVANMRDMVAKTIKAGAVPVLVTFTPHLASPTTKTKAMSWNAWIRRYAAENGYPLVDMHAVTVDPTTGDWKAGLVSPTDTDNVHPSEAGAKVMGQAYLDAMLPLLRPSTPPLAASQVDTVIFSNALLSATANTLPFNWSKQGSGDMTVATAAATAPGVGTRITMNVTTGTNTGMVRSVTTGFTAGDRIQFAGRIITNGGNTTAQIQFNTPGGTYSSIPLLNVTQALDGIFYAEAVVPAGTTSITCAVMSGVASVSVEQITVRNLTAMGALI